MNHLLRAFAVSCFVPAAALAQQPEPAAPAGAQPPAPLDPVVEPEESLFGGLTYELRAGVLHQFQTDIDSDSGDGGDFRVSRAGVGFDVGIPVGQRMRITPGILYEFSSYDFGFEGVTGGATPSIAELDPWGRIHTTRLGVSAFYQVNERWSVFAAPGVTMSGEEGADWDDSLTVAGAVGASYSFGERGSIGGGIAVSSQIEDDVQALPFLTGRYMFTDRFALRGGGVEALFFGGAGIELTYDICDEVQVAIAGNYRSRRFRLDDSALPNLTPNGVGEESSFPVFGRVTWSFGESRQSSVSLLAGVAVAGELKLDDEGGTEVREEDFDPAPMVGLTVKLVF